jgi:hypothetical protein
MLIRTHVSWLSDVYLDMLDERIFEQVRVDVLTRLSIYVRFRKRWYNLTIPCRFGQGQCYKTFCVCNLELFAPGRPNP